jgi:hypothetical protein
MVELLSDFSGRRRHLAAITILLATISFFAAPSRAASPALPNPILFVTQVPVPDDFTTITSVFGNHKSEPASCARGGDLWIRYGDGTLRNLTREAGFGGSGQQGTNAIAVREPAVHWSGTKAVFSMVVGAPAGRSDYTEFYWQLYEITGFGLGQTPVITKVSNQPTNYNNVAPTYGSDDRIIFASDRPRNGQRHLYPQLDEYEEQPTVTGLWSMDPASGDLFQITHVPSGAFSPSVDSFGRVIFVRWDHLQRDQQADSDAAVTGTNTLPNGTFNFASEAPTAATLTNNRAEVFPESRLGGGNVNGHNFNQFFPWQINEDGTEEETINHVGRHELRGSYGSKSFNDDPNLVDLDVFGDKLDTNNIKTFIYNFLQIRESAKDPGYYYGVDAPEFGTHAGGQIVRLSGAPSVNATQMQLDYLTPPATHVVNDSGTPRPDHTGFYRSPQHLTDGSLIAVHTPATAADPPGQPLSTYDFRLKTLKKVGNYFVPDQPLTPGLTNPVSYYDSDKFITYSGQLWELDPVEVRARPRPARRTSVLPANEQTIFQNEGVDVTLFQKYLRLHNLALIVSRNVTSRDAADRQQPFNLRVPGGTQTIGTDGKIYDISQFQIFQADQIRGKGLRGPASTPEPGRRPLPQILHDPLVDNPPPNQTNIVGSVPIAPDGSVAALVPARRALSWQTVAPDGSPVVRERYWITFQPGEIRTCFSCHGVNTVDQAGRTPASNPPEALRTFLRYWKSQNIAQTSYTTNNLTGHLALTFRRNLAASNLTHVVEVSTNLVDWAAGSTYTPTNNTPISSETTEITRTGTNFQSITIRDNAPLDTAPRRFLRVRVEGP